MRAAAVRVSLQALAVLASVFVRIASAESGPPVDAQATRPPDLVELTTLDPTIHLDVRYATAANLARRRLYPAARAFLERPAAEALVRVHRALAATGFGIVVYDGYRPWSVTRALWDATPPEKREFVADPAEGSRHNRGCAVDVTLFDRADGRAVEMPSDYDETSERAYPTYRGGPAPAREHRDLLRKAMEREGFFVHPSEWWHFDYKDWREYPVLDLAFDDVRPAASPAPSLDLARARIVDLTYTFDDRTLYWPNAPSGFELRSLAHGKTPAGFFYAANAFCAPEHGGTHLDAPVHFGESGWTADAIPVERMIGPAVVIDVSAAVARDRDYRLTIDDVRRFEKRNGPIPRGAIVLLRTGWGARWPDRKRYFGDDTPGRTSALHFPSYGREAAELLVHGRDVRALAVDTPSIDYGPSADFPVHQTVAAANVLGLENVADAGDVPETGAWIVALPMKIGGGSGGPLRVVALVPR
jgi:D-alanyl-D-alanine dipeptidase/kynurenine formamidase